MGLWQLETGWIYWGLLAYLIGETALLQRDGFRALASRRKTDPGPIRGPWSAPEKRGAWFDYPGVSLAINLALILGMILRTPLVIVPALLAIPLLILSCIAALPAAQTNTDRGQVIGAMMGGIVQFLVIITAVVMIMPAGSLPFAASR